MTKNESQSAKSGGVPIRSRRRDQTESKSITAAKRRLLTALITDIRKHHHACIASANNAIHHAAEAGSSLLYAKEAVSHGEWSDWLKNNFSAETGLSLRTAQRYMNVAKHYGDILALANDNHQDALAESSPFAELSVTQALDALKRRNNPRSRPSAKQLSVRGNDWLTPASVVEAACKLLGGIDLDPAAESAACNIPAKTHFSSEYDSLRSDVLWEGRVFLSPGCVGDLTPWVAKALAAFETGAVSSAVLVLPAAGHPSWAPRLRSFPTAFARELFQVRQTESEHTATLSRPLMFVYLTRNEDASVFAELFSSFADAFVPYISPESNK